MSTHTTRAALVIAILLVLAVWLVLAAPPSLRVAAAESGTALVNVLWI